MIDLPGATPLKRNVPPPAAAIECPHLGVGAYEPLVRSILEC